MQMDCCDILWRRLLDYWRRLPAELRAYLQRPLIKVVAVVDTAAAVVAAAVDDEIAIDQQWEQRTNFDARIRLPSNEF